MTPSELAKNLVDTDKDRRESLLSEHKTADPVEIAESLQEMCYEAWTQDPRKVSTIAETLQFLADKTNDLEIRGFAEWAWAICKMVDGDITGAIKQIDRSESTFLGIDRSLRAAKTQTSKIYGLAMLGRYDDAVECGKKALEVFLRHNDLYSAGKTEHNIGNLFWRRDMYRESEPYLESARQRFVEIDDQRQIAMVENCQAFVKTLQNQFPEAETIYKRALERSSVNNLTVTEAEIEIGLSNLYLFQSRFDLALKFMERARQKYEQLVIPNQLAICEMEIADIYLDLNLLPEAVEFYNKCESRFADLGLQAELARCSLNHARALIRFGKNAEATILLDQAEKCYESEGNSVAAGSVQLARSQLFLIQGDHDGADAQVNLAISAFEKGDNLRSLLFARWLRAEIANADGRTTDAIAELEATLTLANEQSKEVEYLCFTSLGKLTESESHLESAIELVENSRATLSSEEMRTSFFADKVVPFNELIKIKLSRGQFDDAFRWHERSRSRTLADQLSRTKDTPIRDEKLASVRTELNAIYNRINRSSLAGSVERNRVEMLRKQAFAREREYSELLRRLGTNNESVAIGPADIETSKFRHRLQDSTLVEFASIDGRITAFVISKDDLTTFPNYVDEADVDNEIRRFLFQIKTGRLIDRLSSAGRAAAMTRLRTHSRRLYDLLLKPIANAVSTERVVFAPARMLNYLPFHALHNGIRYLIEDHEVSYAPSASVLDRCLKRATPKRERALIVGVADELLPNVEAEVRGVGQFFDKAITLLNQEATIENIRQNAPGIEVIHIACHGKFRPDNPDFSSLTLYTEELSVYDVQNLPLENRLVVLSACESGLNEIVRGEELIGLTRAFFAAGAGSLILSLWRVSDQVTFELMRAFYEGFCDGKGIAKSLRTAQLNLIGRDLHPYFWSPFVVSGRW